MKECLFCKLMTEKIVNNGRKINEYILHLKENYGFSNNIELKWNKVDKKTKKLYLDVINYINSDIQPIYEIKQKCLKKLN